MAAHAASSTLSRSPVFGLWECDLRTREMAWDHSAGAIFGLGSGGPATFAEIRERVHPDDRGAVDAAMEDALEGAVGGRCELRVRVFREEEVRHLRILGRVFLDPEGVAVRVAGVVEDETDRTPDPEGRYRTLAREHLEDLEATYRHAPVGLCMVDPDLRFRRVNERMAEMNGAPMDAHVGRPLDEVVPDLAEQARAIMDRVLSGEPVLDIEVRGETPGRPGEERIWLESWHPVRGPHGEIRGASVVAEDVTAERRAEEERARLLEELKEARREAEEASHSKSRYLAAMSHDLRTPLNAIMGYADLLEMEVHGALSPRQREAVDRIRANQRILLSLMEDLLHFARIEAGKLEVELQPVDLAGILLDVDAAVRPDVERRKLTYRLVPCPPGVRAMADPERVRQVLLNLVGNAIKYSPEGGRIRLTCATGGGRVRVAVQDHGPGIDKADQERIFDPFTRLGRDTEGTEGMGLGLAISRHLARAMGGEVTVDSREGEGSVFILDLQKAEPEADPGVRAD